MKNKKLPSSRDIALHYESFGYDKIKEISDLLAKDLYNLVNDLKESGIQPTDYQIIHDFVGSSPKYKTPYDYPGGLIEVALWEILSKYGVTGNTLPDQLIESISSINQ